LARAESFERRRNSWLELVPPQRDASYVIPSFYLAIICIFSPLPTKRISDSIGKDERLLQISYSHLKRVKERLIIKRPISLSFTLFIYEILFRKWWVRCTKERWWANHQRPLVHAHYLRVGKDGVCWIQTTTSRFDIGHLNSCHSPRWVFGNNRTLVSRGKKGFIYLTLTGVHN
jgi:hypothetical protein